MIKKLILIVAISITFNAYSEPSDFVRNELINKPVTYMSIGLDHCSKEFQKEAEKSFVDCYYNWDENKLEFRAVSSNNDLTANDYEKALKLCDSKLHNDLRSWFVTRNNAYVKMAHLSGFNPRGYIYKDSGREEEFDKFIARSTATVSLWTSIFSADNHWECVWEIGDQQPSLKWISRT